MAHTKFPSGSWKLVKQKMLNITFISKDKVAVWHHFLFCLYLLRWQNLSHIWAHIILCKKPQTEKVVWTWRDDWPSGGPLHMKDLLPGRVPIKFSTVRALIGRWSGRSTPPVVAYSGRECWLYISTVRAHMKWQIYPP